MPEPNLPQTKNELDRLRLDVHKERAGAAVSSALAFSPAYPALAITGAVFPKLGKFVGKFGFAVDVKPRPGKPALVKPTPYAILYAAPAPIGITPPEVFRLAPDYVGRTAPGLPKSELLATEASPTRLALFEVEERQRAIEAQKAVIARQHSVIELQRRIAILTARAAQTPVLAGDYASLIQHAQSRIFALGGPVSAKENLAAGIAQFGTAGRVPIKYLLRAPAEGENAQGAARLQSTNPPDP